MTAVTPVLDWVTGDATGLAIPGHVEAFLEGGPDFLTRAFHAFGTLAPDNAVTAITACDRCPGGSTGHKYFLSLAYARDEPGLERDLFLKFSRDFTDRRRDWQRTEMAGEARFVALSRMEGFPIRVPKGWFADYEAASGTGIVITERIGFGVAPIEPHRGKCLDRLTLDDPLPYYRAIVASLARLAAAHRSGALGPEIEATFPWDAVTGSADPIRYDSEKLELALAGIVDFAERAPQLLPPEVRSAEFHAMLARDAHRIRAHEAEIQSYLRGNSDLIALCHWNAHVDNNWFWRDADGGLHNGLIDWGRVGQISFGSALWGGLSAAHHDIWDEHLDELLALFVSEYAVHGGPRIEVDELKLHLALHMAAMGVARVLAFPEVIEFRLPECVHASGPDDPMFLPVEPARNCLHIYTVFLKHWHRTDFGACLDRVLAR